MTSNAPPMVRKASERTSTLELLAATVGLTCTLAIVLLVDSALSGLALGAYGTTMTTASVIDLRVRRVPNRLLAWAIPSNLALFAAAATWSSQGSFTTGLTGGLVLFGLFALIHVGSPTQFGAGDVKASFLVGFAVCWFGLGELQWLLFWSWIGLAVVGVPVLVRHGRSRAAALPFIPVLTTASLVTILLAA